MPSTLPGVYPCAKIRIFKQITTASPAMPPVHRVFILVQRYEFLSKSQRAFSSGSLSNGVYPCAKIRIFKQITTRLVVTRLAALVFILVQRYEFLSKSQRETMSVLSRRGVYPCAKIRIFKQKPHR